MVFGLLEKVKAQSTALTVTEVDITAHPEVVQQYGILATPAIAMNGRLEFRGIPTARQLLARLRERGHVLADTSASEAAPRGLLGRLRSRFR